MRRGRSHGYEHPLCWDAVPRVTGRTVYALAGVDPADVVVMRGDPALSAGAFVVFVDPARPTSSIADVPGMCTYIVAPAC